MTTAARHAPAAGAGCCCHRRAAVLCRYPGSQALVCKGRAARIGSCVCVCARATCGQQSRARPPGAGTDCCPLIAGSAECNAAPPLPTRLTCGLDRDGVLGLLVSAPAAVLLKLRQAVPGAAAAGRAALSEVAPAAAAAAAPPAAAAAAPAAAAVGAVFAAAQHLIQRVAVQSLLAAAHHLKEGRDRVEDT